MKWNRRSRRFFLQGAGAALTLPFLRSLLPSSAQAAPTPKNLIGISARHGLYRMYGPTSELMPKTTVQNDTLLELQKVTTSAHPIHQGTLTELADNGVISALIDADFAPLLPKMMMLQGLDYTGLGGHHNGQFGNWETMTSASGNPSMASLDVVVSDYYSKVGLGGDQVTYSASKKDNTYGPSFREDGTHTTSRFFNPATLWDKYLGNSTIPTDFKELLVDQVLEDYKSVRAGARLGSEDRHRVDAHIEHLFETQTKIKTISAACTQERPEEGILDRQLVLETFNDVIVGLIACDMCHVFLGWALALVSDDPEVWHAWAHGAYSSTEDSIADLTSYQKMKEQNGLIMKVMCLDLAKKLDALELLDDSLIVCIQEHNKRGHEAFNVPVITFGSAGGAFKTNQYVDYRYIGNPDMDCDDYGTSRYGFPMQQLYANILLAMGVPAEEFEALNKPRSDGATGPFQPGSGYGMNLIHDYNGPRMLKHYSKSWWNGYDLSGWLPLIHA